MPDASTVEAIVKGGVAFAALCIVVYLLRLQSKERGDNATERKATMEAIERIASKATDALDRNTSAISKLESAVEKLESRLDEHDRVLERVGMNRGMT